MDFLTIGHVAKDMVPGGYAVGGTVTYASVTVLRLGRRPGVLTRLGPDLVLPEVYRAFDVIALPSRQTTTFENVYTSSGRVQTIHAVADRIGVRDIPQALREEPDIVLLGPLANEIDPEVAGIFAKPTLALVPQGWMRSWNSQGHVSHTPIDCANSILPHANVLVLSIEDIAHDLSLVACYSEMVPLTVLTRGAAGCDVYQHGQVTRVSPRPAREVDPTGAGDTFAAAFLVRLQETGDPIHSARFANVAASFCVEGHGYSNIPTRAQIEAWLSEHDKR
jgi:sugar/nucleoside kinase (ribokinase family)